MNWIRNAAIVVKAAKKKPLLGYQARLYSIKSKVDKDLIQYDESIRKEDVVEIQTEADLAKVPPKILEEVLPRPIEIRNKVLIIGGGTGGLAVAHNLVNMAEGLDLNIGIVDYGKVHFNESLYPLLGFKQVDHRQKSARLIKEVLPEGVTLFEDRVMEFVPSKNYVKTVLNRTIYYDTLVLATGSQPNLKPFPTIEEPLMRHDSVRALVEKSTDALAQDKWGVLKDLKFSLSQESITSVNLYDSSGDVGQYLTQNWDREEKRIIFAIESSTSVKEPGALYSTIFMLHDKLKKMKARYGIAIDLYFPGDRPPLFELDLLNDKLKLLLQQYKINLYPKHQLVEVEEFTHIASFKRLDSNEDVKIPYSSLHFTPATHPDPQVKASSLVSGSGLVDVHRFTLQHNKHKNIFALGECANIPYRTVAGTVFGQAPVVAWNVLNQLVGKSGNLKYYDGWHTSPIMTGLSAAFIPEWNDDGLLLQPSLSGTKLLTESRYAYWIYRLTSRFYFDFLAKTKDQGFFAEPAKPAKVKATPEEFTFLEKKVKEIPINPETGNVLEIKLNKKRFRRK